TGSVGIDSLAEGSGEAPSFDASGDSWDDEAVLVGEAGSLVVALVDDSPLPLAESSFADAQPTRKSDTASVAAVSEVRRDTVASKRYPYRLPRVRQFVLRYAALFGEGNHF